eukprot:CAMPEP_0201652586 /NCGR_PEP_ID=MMETSP0493-20130528/44554_1 /ASSEMBLY_ACC=CAM_ASM_000838 /TAXON_ID=420259 /ORGANISM="Thalassiosira gravida, Strain GMp14c1" /LENGTH=445 /DNA_ID=CAMNT_0048129109 /DNA_START=106 /DNA_END=1443 /DNA_ORIENTATION=-
MPSHRQAQPLMIEGKNSDLSVPNGDGSLIKQNESPIINTPASNQPYNPESFARRRPIRFLFCFTGLQLSYLTWGYMQELIMTTTFTPTASAPDGRFPSAAFCVFSNRFLAIIVAVASAPDGRFPSAAFCVFSNRFLAIIVAVIAVKIRHGAVLANNVAPLVAFAPCALSNTMSSWIQYASLRYVSFPVQTVFKSSKIIPVMVMGKVLKGTGYPISQYVEAFLITVGVAIFSIFSKSSDRDNITDMIGLLFMCMYICFDSFTSQWQDTIYVKYGRANVDPFQMMLGVNSWAILITTSGLIINGDIPKIIEFFRVNSWAILITTSGLIINGDIPKIIEFFKVNPIVLNYNIISAISSASGQLFIYNTIKEFGPIVFTVIMTTRQMLSICVSFLIFQHPVSVKALCGVLIVFGVLFYQGLRGLFSWTIIECRLRRFSDERSGAGGVMA